MDIKVLAQELLGLSDVEVLDVELDLKKYSEGIKAKYSSKEAIVNVVAELIAKQIPDEKFVAILVAKLPSYLQWLSFLIAPLILKAKAIIIKEIIEAVSESISK